MKKRFIAAIAATVSISGLLAMGYSHNEGRLDGCNSGSIDDCEYIAKLSGDSYKNRITNADWQAKLTAKIEADAKKKADIAEAAAASRKRLAEQAAKERAATAAAEAKFKAEGWWEQKPGIFVRWCGGEHGYCPGKESYQDYSWRAMVWCKERACGDIYAKLNISQNGTVVGWTNETAYGGYGQKVVLTFGSHTRGSGRIVEFNARG